MQQRRASDRMTLNKLASTITAVAVLFGALTLIGSTVFAKVEDLEILEKKVVCVEKVQIRLDTQLKGISDGIKDIKKMIKR